MIFKFKHCLEMDDIMSVGVHCSLLAMRKIPPAFYKATAGKFVIIYPENKHLENECKGKLRNITPRQSAGGVHLFLGKESPVQKKLGPQDTLGAHGGCAPLLNALSTWPSLPCCSPYLHILPGGERLSSGVVIPSLSSFVFCSYASLKPKPG